MNIDYKNICEKGEEYLTKSLIKNNYQYNEYLNPMIYRQHPFKFECYAYDVNQVIGGIYGHIDDGYWLYIELLYVENNYRHQKIATSLMQKALKYAQEKECIGIRLNTWNFQAKEFYEFLGYEVYGTLNNYPPNSTLYSMKKVLINEKEDFPKVDIVINNEQNNV